MTTKSEDKMRAHAPDGDPQDVETPTDDDGVEMTPGASHRGNGDSPPGSGHPRETTPDDFDETGTSPPGYVPHPGAGGSNGAEPGGSGGHPVPYSAWGRRAEAYRASLSPGHQAQLANDMGLPACVFGPLGLGWDPARQCLTCPERDPAGQVIGITRRHADGRAQPMGGGRPGLYYADGWHAKPGAVLCMRGIVDTAAAEAMGLAVVGLPAHTAGADALVQLLAGLPEDRPILVVGTDETRPDGRRPGKEIAVAVAVRLTELLRRPVLHATPPGMRSAHDWLLQRAGGDGGAADLGGLGAQFQADLLAVAREAGDWEPPRPFDQVDVPEFPVTALASWQRDFVGAEAEATQTPVDLAAMLVLAATAVAGAGKAVVQVRPGHAEPLNLYAATALPPGSRKSAVFRAVVAPIQEYERERAEQVAPQIAQVTSQREILKNTLKQRQKEAAKAEGAEREGLIAQAGSLAAQLAQLVVPGLPRLLTDDATPERLVGLLAENGGRMGVFSAEGGVFDLMAGKSGKIDVYLKGHVGDSLWVDRVSRAKEVVDNPALTLGLAVQPSVIRGLGRIRAARERGLLGRFLFALPRSLVGVRDVDPPPVPSTVLGGYRTHLRAILELEQPGMDDEGQPVVRQITLTPAAYQRYCDFEAELEPQLAEVGPLGAMADWASKLAGAVARIAGGLHLADQAGNNPMPWQEPISPATMGRGILIGRYLLEHARAAFALLGRDPLVEDARYVLGWVVRRGGDPFTKRDCSEATKGRFRTVAALEPALDLLARLGFIRERLPEGQPGRGRKPSPVYEINPLETAGVSHEAAPASVVPLPSADLPEGDDDAPTDEPDALPAVEPSEEAVPDFANSANDDVDESPLVPGPAESPANLANCANDDADEIGIMTGPCVYLVLGDDGPSFQIAVNGPTADVPTDVGE